MSSSKNSGNAGERPKPSGKPEGRGMQGPTGPTGPNGPAGPTGPTGTTGPTPSIGSSTLGHQSSASNSSGTSYGDDISLDPSRLDELTHDELAKAQPHVERTGNPIADIYPEEATGDNDSLQYHHIAAAIAELTLNTELKPPFNIGILGPYGSGKTKILRQIDNQIKSDESAKSRIKGIAWFDVGRHHDSKHIWAALLYSLFQAFTKEYGWRAPFKYAMARPKWRNWTDGIIFTVATIASVAAILWVFRTVPEKFELIRVAISLLPLYLCWRNIRKIWRHPVVVDTLHQFISFDAVPHIIKDRIKLENRVANLFKAWAPDDGRILLFVDNIDRCARAQVIPIVDELYALMTAEGVKDKLIAVVAVDDILLRNILTERAGGCSEEPIDYLEKLFALSIRLPPIGASEACGIARDIISYTGHDIESKGPEYLRHGKGPALSDSGLSDEEKSMIYTNILNLCRNTGGLTPRKTIRYIFAYRFLKNLWPRLYEDNVVFDCRKVLPYLAHQISGQRTPGEHLTVQADAFEAHFRRTLDLVHLDHNRDGNT